MMILCEIESMDVKIIYIIMVTIDLYINIIIYIRLTYLSFVYSLKDYWKKGRNVNIVI